jgi:hypothetical protein
MKAIEIQTPMNYFVLMLFSVLAFYSAFEYFRKRKIELPRPRTVANGILFSFSFALFLSIVNVSNIVMLSALTTLNVIVFTAINSLHHKEVVNAKVVAKLFVAAILILAAVEVIYLFNQQTGFTALSQNDFAVAFVLIFSFGASNYLLSHNSKRTTNEENFMLWIFVVSATVAMIAFIASGAGLQLSRAIIAYAVTGGLVMFISVVTTVYSYRYMKNYKGISRFIGTNVLFLVSETDVIFISGIYAVFVGAINPDVILSILLIVCAMFIVSTIENERNRNIFGRRIRKLRKSL